MQLDRIQPITRATKSSKVVSAHDLISFSLLDLAAAGCAMP